MLLLLLLLLLMVGVLLPLTDELLFLLDAELELDAGDRRRLVLPIGIQGGGGDRGSVEPRRSAGVVRLVAGLAQVVERDVLEVLEVVEVEVLLVERGGRVARQCSSMLMLMFMMMLRRLFGDGIGDGDRVVVVIVVNVVFAAAASADRVLESALGLERRQW